MFENFSEAELRNILERYGVIDHSELGNRGKTLVILRSHVDSVSGMQTLCNDLRSGLINITSRIQIALWAECLEEENHE